MENVKIPHRLLLRYYGQNNEHASASRKVRMALSEAVIHEAILMKKVKIENEVLSAGSEHSTGHSIIDQVADQIQITPGKSYSEWVKQLSANESIALHVTENLVDNNLLTEDKKKALFRKAKTSYQLKDQSHADAILNYIQQSQKNDARSEISLELLRKYEIA